MSRLPNITTRQQALEQTRSDWQFGLLILAMFGDDCDLSVFRTNTWLRTVMGAWTIEEIEYIRKPYTEVTRWNAAD